MKDEYIVIEKERLNKWFILLNLSGQNTKLAVAREINELLEQNTEKVATGQMQAVVNDKNEMEL